MHKNVVINGLKAIPTHVALKKGAQFRKMGFVAIQGLIKASLSSALEKDAIASIEQDKEILDSRMTSLENNTPETRIYQSTKRSESINVLPQLQNALLPLLKVLTGHLLVPLNSWYIYYERTDEILLHADPEKSDISVLISVLGQVGPLHFHPELESQNQNQLDDYYQGPNWSPNSGSSLIYPYDGILINRGHRIPHHRAGKPIPQRSAVAALHYTILR